MEIPVLVDEPINRWSRYHQTPVKRKSSCCKKFCCCFFLFAICVGVTAFFIFPRVPDVQVSDPIFDESLQRLRSTGDALNANEEEPFTLLFDLSIEIKSKSENWIDWYLDAIKVDGVIEDPKTRRVNQAASAQALVTDGLISKMATSVIYLPITVSYTSRAPIQSLATDPDFLELVAPCGFGEGNDPRPVLLKYRVEIELGWLKWTGYRPVFEGETNFPCPLTEEQLAQIINGAAPLG
jgi:hypothetical protein